MMKHSLPHDSTLWYSTFRAYFVTHPTKILKSPTELDWPMTHSFTGNSWLLLDKLTTKQDDASKKHKARLYQQYRVNEMSAHSRHCCFEKMLQIPFHKLVKEISLHLNEPGAFFIHDYRDFATCCRRQGNLLLGK